jgi:hypothetical protein
MGQGSFFGYYSRVGVNRGNFCLGFWGAMHSKREKRQSQKILHRLKLVLLAMSQKPGFLEKTGFLDSSICCSGVILLCPLHGRCGKIRCCDAGIVRWWQRHS